MWNIKHVQYIMYLPERYHLKDMECTQATDFVPCNIIFIFLLFFGRIIFCLICKIAVHMRNKRLYLKVIFS